MSILNSYFVSSTIEKNSIIKEVEKDKYGAVFTPEPLIYKMLENFHPDVWRNPHLKWLEPTAGIGNFTMIIYLKLMKGLAYWEPVELTRSNHIIEKMLFMVEINEENIQICKKIFGEKSNILQADFLKSNVFDLTFDIIIGNPPFQDDTLGKKRVGSKNKLYERILIKCLTLLNDSGYLCFITPDNLFSGGSKTYLELIKKNIITISFEKSIQLYFPKIQQFMCFFLIQNIENAGNINQTRIVDNKGDPFDCIIKDRPVNPVRDWNLETEQLIQQYILNTKNNGVYNRGKPLSKYQIGTINECVNECGVYELIYQPNKKLVTDNLSISVGFGLKKIVIFLISPRLEFEHDFNGLYGIGPNTFYFPIQNKEEGVILSEFFKSDIYKKIMLSTKTNRQFIKLSCIQYFDINKIKNSL